jgi:hypothetical protein
MLMFFLYYTNTNLFTGNDYHGVMFFCDSEIDKDKDNNMKSVETINVFRRYIDKCENKNFMMEKPLVKD